MRRQRRPRDPRRFARGLRALRIIAVACVAASAATESLAQVVADPVPGPIPVGELTARIELVVILPDSGSLSKPRARPMHVDGDGSGRTFVCDQNGFVLQLLPGGAVSVFLDVKSATPMLANQLQRGLSSFAFHPDYHRPGTRGYGKFYTASSQPKNSGTPDYTVPAGAPVSHHSVIHEWTASTDPDAIDPLSARELLRIEEPYHEHNVGAIAFRPGLPRNAPDFGLLYIAQGDGGNYTPLQEVDPHFVAQDLSSPLGKILRIDPLEPLGGGAAYSIPSDNPFANDGDPDTLGEIWAYGLRNPHRFAWDRAGAGRMLISDIGQANVEEIDLGQAGANYGWSEREGTYLVEHFNVDDVFELPPDDAAFGFTYPVVQYDHDEGDRAISGGYVQRGSTSPLEDRYVFGDLASGRVFHVPVEALDGSGQAAFEQLRLIDDADGQEKTLLQMVNASRADLRFGLDDDGRIYLVSKQDGSVRRIVVQLDRAQMPALSPPASIVLALALALVGVGAAIRWADSRA